MELKNRIQFILILFFYFLSVINYSQVPEKKIIKLNYKTASLPFGLSRKIPEQFPIIALSLSGGGSRGFSQIGVLKAFEEYNIPFQILVGTSMGSIVGGLYSSGYSIDELDSIAKFTPWSDLLSVDSKTNRRELFIDKKITEDKAILTLRLDGLKPIIPTSVNDGQKLSNYLNLLILKAPIKIIDNFSKLERQFYAVCTNLENGSMVLLNSGSLSQALRASSSVSFLLSPVHLESLILVDGGLVANIPIIPAKELGAELIFAVNSTSPLREKQELEFPWNVADQIISIPMKLQNEQQLKYADVIITPNLNGKEATDFSSVDFSIMAGYKSAVEQVSIIKEKIDSVFFDKIKEEEYFINNFEIKKTPNIYDAQFTEYEKLDSLSSFQIMKEIFKVECNGGYKEVFAEVEQINNKNIITFIAVDNPNVTEIVCDGITLLSNEDVNEVKNDLINKPYNPIKIVAASKRILKMYRSLGYSLAEIDTVIFDESTGKLFLLFKEGRISDIIVEGNLKTNKTVITRELPFAMGDIFIDSKIQQGLTNLRNTNFFENVTFSVEKIKGVNILRIKVQEKISSLIRFGFKIEGENKPQVSFDLRDENFFGTGTELGLLVFLSDRGRSYVLEQKSFRLFETYLTYSVNGYYKISDVYTYKDDISTSKKFFSRSRSGEYRQIYYGFSLSVGTQVQRFGNVILSAKYETNEIKNKSLDAVNAFRSNIVCFRSSFTIDTQDKYPYPEKGLRLSGFYETAQKVIGGEIGYTNFGAEYEGYLNISERHTLGTVIKLGFGDATLPLTQQYSLGGQYSFFGMRENEYRGRQLFLTSLEYRQFLPVKIFFDTYVSIRYDLGSIWEKQEVIKFKNLRHGIGGTISFNTPIGPSEFSVGKSFTLTENLPGNPLSWGPTYFYFSIGYYY
jgi:NTE family protein